MMTANMNDDEDLFLRDGEVDDVEELPKRPTSPSRRLEIDNLLEEKRLLEKLTLFDDDLYYNTD